MKKVLTILAVLALAAPAMAQDAVTITATPGPGTLTIHWDATGATNGGPVGFGLSIHCDAGTVTGVESVDSFFDVFIDFAYDEETTGDGYDPYGEGKTVLSNIAAKPGEAGVATLPAADVVLSFAGLGGGAAPLNEPPLSGDIVVTFDAPATVDVDIDTIRGGVVNKGGAMTVSGLPATDIVIPDDECLYVGQVFNYAGPGTAVTLTVTTTMYNNWVTLGKPDCWCCLAQKAGNSAYATTSATRVDAQDMAAVKNAWFKSIGQAGYNACADGNLSGRVDAADMALVKNHWFLQTGGCP